MDAQTKTTDETLPCFLSVMLGCEVAAPVGTCRCAACVFESEAARVKAEWERLTTDLGGEAGAA